MNRGSIPGFYYDEEKKKYFRIQANHLVPQDAKYSKGNVKQVDRQKKKRKLEERKESIRLKHTVKRNPILRHSLAGGVGLLREHGAHSTTRYLDSADFALVSHLQPSRTKCVTQPWMREVNIRAAGYLPSTRQMITAISGGPHTTATLIQASNWDPLATRFALDTELSNLAFDSSMTSMSVTAHANAPRMLVCARGFSGLGNVYMSGIPSPDKEDSFAASIVPNMYVRLGPLNTYLSTSSINSATGRAAILGTTGVFILDTLTEACSSFPLQETENCDYGLDWLDSNVVAFSSSSQGHGKHRVMLWDTRTSGGTSTRFKLRQRITGILNNGNSNDHQLLVATNHSINLFDTRMARSKSKFDTPLLSFPHVHQGPELQYATNGLGLVAAVDRDNVVQVYSTRSGKSLGPLKTPRVMPNKPLGNMLTNLSWYEDDMLGSTLQACLGGDIARWTWGGLMQGEDE